VFLGCIGLGGVGGGYWYWANNAGDYTGINEGDLQPDFDVDEPTVKQDFGGLLDTGDEPAVVDEPGEPGQVTPKKTTPTTTSTTPKKTTPTTTSTTPKKTTPTTTSTTPKKTTPTTTSTTPKKTEPTTTSTTPKKTEPVETTTPTTVTPPAPGGSYDAKVSLISDDKAELRCGDGQQVKFANSTRLTFTGTVSCVVMADGGRGVLTVSSAGAYTCEKSYTGSTISCSGP
jgi:hypothetical protein